MNLTSPVLLAGNSTVAYRDPAAVYHQGWFYLYFTLVETFADRIPCATVAWCKSNDLALWTSPIRLTPRDPRLNFGSPGNIVRVRDEWVMCLQTYPRPNGERCANHEARIWTMRSHDLEHWSQPQLLRVKGPNVPRESMGRMIDPFLLHSKDDPHRWYCFYKQEGVSIASSEDLYVWNHEGRIAGGENACVVVDGDQYVLFTSPENGIEVRRSEDLVSWEDEGLLTLGQSHWPWAAGRLTAGFVLDLRMEPSFGVALLFFHGSQYPEGDPRGGFDNYASIGLAWSKDLRSWTWPGVYNGMCDTTRPTTLCNGLFSK